jgi:hypothetical protein
MDPERVRGYLQVACAGLGFDIGEIWWTQNETGTSTLATIEEKKDEKVGRREGDGKKRFVQLYTSKNYADRRADLVIPEKQHPEAIDEGHVDVNEPLSESELEKHKLSPQLVDAISKSAQVVWANTQREEGLLGRSDMRLQTAVGMPVAVDADGNMCVVVMFSPENLESTDEAMEYLRFLSSSATSSSIPCLFPVFDSNTMRPALMPHPHNDDSSQTVTNPPDPSLGKDITAHYCSMEDGGDGSSRDGSIVHRDHDVTGAPKDCFGIPMLPSFAELGGSLRNDNTNQSPSPLHDPFDEASFGVWATIMNCSDDEICVPEPETQSIDETKQSLDENGIPYIEPIVDKPIMERNRRERIEEFCSAFLELSVFDVSDVWMPVEGESYGTLGHVTSTVSTEKNAALNDFTVVSQYSQIKLWSGAVGRAFASGNPVWSANYDVIVDSARAPAFEKAKIKTALAVPIFSSGAVSPACVLCCYSLVRAEAVPTVLRFVQQALRLLWTGLDKIEPHQSIGKDRWKDVAPADLGEMAADVEMQHAFLRKKRPHNFISASPEKFSAPMTVAAATARERSSSLSEQLHTIELVRPIPESAPSQSILSAQMQQLGVSPRSGNVSVPTQPQVLLTNHPETFSIIQSHLQDAVRSIGSAVPYSEHQHLDTNRDGTKRAHVVAVGTDPLIRMNSVSPSQQQSFPVSNGVTQPVVHQPLPMPQPLATHFPIGYANTKAPPKPVAIPTPVYSGRVSENRTESRTFVGGIAQASVARHTGEVPGHPGFSNGGPPLIHSGFTSSMTGIQVGESAVGSTASAVSLQTGIASAPTSVADSGQICQPASAKPCRIQGCDDIALSRRPYCIKHSGNRLCEHAGCTKCAQGSTRFCIAHGGGRRCTYPGCDKGARDKFFCAAHGGGKRCAREGCTKSAVGGSNLCTSHGGGRRCSVEGCDKSAQSSTKFCVKHGGGKKCAHAGCVKVARGRTQFCAAHGGGVRCKLAGCNRVAIGKLQLCRTHGGGSTRATSSNPSPTHPSVHL